MLCFQCKELTPLDVNTQFTTLTLKIKSLYVAYAPEFDVSAYGGCLDEAVNNLVDEIGHYQTQPAERATKGNSHALD